MQQLLSQGRVRVEMTGNKTCVLGSRLQEFYQPTLQTELRLRKR